MRKKIYSSHSQCKKVYRILNKLETLQEKSEEAIILMDNLELDKFPNKSAIHPSYKIESESLARGLLNYLDIIAKRDLCFKSDTSRWRKIIEMIYFDEKSLDEIGEYFSLSPARIGQIRDQSLNIMNWAFKNPDYFESVLRQGF